MEEATKRELNTSLGSLKRLKNLNQIKPLSESRWQVLSVGIYILQKIKESGSCRDEEVNSLRSTIVAYCYGYNNNPPKNEINSQNLLALIKDFSGRIPGPKKFLFYTSSGSRLKKTLNNILSETQNLSSDGLDDFLIGKGFELQALPVSQNKSARAV